VGIYCAPVSRLKDPQGFFNPTPTKTKQLWTHHNFMELGIPLPPQSPSNPQAINLLLYQKSSKICHK
jgi:hypothetical protein